MGIPYDRFLKWAGTQTLAAFGSVDEQRRLRGGAQYADLCFEPDPARMEATALGLLGRIIAVRCLIEGFSHTPDWEDVNRSVHKLMVHRAHLLWEVDRRSRRLVAEGAKREPFVEPILWIFSAGRPTNAMRILGAEPAEGWPPGVYLSADVRAALAARRERRRAKPHHVGFVVASELPRDRSTLIVRFMTGGSAFADALADLAALPEDGFERKALSLGHVLESIQAIAEKQNRTEQENKLLNTTRDIVKELREEGRRDGLQEGRRDGLREGHRAGRAEEAARAVLAVLRARGIVVTDPARQRILAQTDPALLERWIERAVVASSLGEAIDDPS